MYRNIRIQNNERGESIEVLKKIAEFEREIGEEDQALEEQITREELREQAVNRALDRRGF